MQKQEFPIHVIRTGGSIDHVYHTDTETIGFDPDISPVIETLKRLGLTYASDSRVSGVNSSDLTEDHLKELVKVLWKVHSDTRIIVTSGKGAIPRIAQEIKDSKFLNRDANNGWSTPNIVQVATDLPGFLGDRGDIRDSMSTAHAIVAADNDLRGQHLVVVGRTLLFASDILAGSATIPETPEDQKIVF